MFPGIRRWPCTFRSLPRLFGADTSTLPCCRWTPAGEGRLPGPQVFPGVGGHSPCPTHASVAGFWLYSKVFGRISSICRSGGANLSRRAGVSAPLRRRVAESRAARFAAVREHAGVKNSRLWEFYVVEERPVQTHRPFLKVNLKSERKNCTFYKLKS